MNEKKITRKHKYTTTSQTYQQKDGKASQLEY